MPNTCSDGENINLTIQSQLLKWVEMPLENCSTLFILAGAFQNFEREEKKTSMQIGFNRQNVKKDDVVGQLELRQQLLKSGNVMPELVGRITQIVEVEELDTGAYRAILQREINCKKEFFRKEYGLSLEISDEAKEIMVRRFCNQEISMGARTVKNSLTELLGTAAFDAILEKKNLIMIDEEALKNGKPILLLSKDRCRGC